MVSDNILKFDLKTFGELLYSIVYYWISSDFSLHYSLFYPVGIDAITRREAQEEHFSNPELHAHLYARDEDDTNAPPEITEPSWEFYEVSQMECQSGFSNLNNWQLLELNDLKCSENPNKVSI